MLSPQYWLIAGALVGVALLILLYLWAFDRSGSPPSRPVEPEDPRDLRVRPRPPAPPQSGRAVPVPVKVVPPPPTPRREAHRRDGGRGRERPAPAPSAGPPLATPLFAVADVEKRYRDADGESVVATRLAGQPLYLGHEVTALIGPSGVGKSTLLGLLAGLDVPSNDAGRIAFEGQELPRHESPQLRGHRAGNVSVVFQSLNLVTHLSALENAALPLLIRGVARVEALKRAEANLEAVGLDRRQMLRKPAKLSGGQQQRVAVARAFTADTRAVLADEPTGSLDPETAEHVMQVFRDMVRRTGRPVVIVTHNVDLAREYADRVIRLTAGGYEEVQPSRGGSAPPQSATPAFAPRMGFTNQFRYALSDLWHRRAITAITMLVIGISAAYTLLVGFAGERMYHVQQQSLEQTLLTHVVAAPKDSTRNDLRFSQAKMDEVAGWPEVEKAFACVELNAQVSVGDRGDKAELATLSSTVPDDPGLRPERLAWGRPVRKADREGEEVAEAVIGRRLYERLGGAVTAAGEPTTKTVTVELSRTGGGRTEKESRKFEVVGLSRQDDKVFLPLDQVARFDLWREGKIAAFSTDFRTVSADVPVTEALAYVPAESAGKFLAELNELGTFRAEPLKADPDQPGRPDRVAALEEVTEPFWVAVPKETPPELAAALRKLPGCELFETRYLKLGDAIAAAPKPDDPRWGPPLVKSARDFRRVGVRGVGPAFAGLADGYSLPESVPVDANLLMTPETLDWLAFDERGPDARTATLVNTTSPTFAAALASRRPLLSQADVANGWAFLIPPDDSTDPRKAGAALVAGEAEADADTFSESVFPVKLTPQEKAPAGFKENRELSFRVVPSGLFRELGVETPAGKLLCVYAVPPGSKAEAVPTHVQAGPHVFEVARTVSAPREGVWVRAADTAGRLPEGRRAGLLVRGRWDGVVRVVERARMGKWEAEKETTRLPRSFAAVLAGPADAVRKLPGFAESGASAVEFVVAEASLERPAVGVLLAPAGDLRGSPRFARLPAGDRAWGRPGFVERDASIRVGPHGWRLPADFLPDLPDGLVVVPDTIFREVAFRSAGRSAQNKGELRSDLRVADAYTYSAVQRLLKEKGIGAKVLVNGRPAPEPYPPPVEYRGFRVMVSAKEEGKSALPFDRRALGRLQAVLEEFSQRAVVPLTSVALSREGRRLTCQSGVTRDPRRFALQLSGGNWFEESKGPRQVVLGRNLCDELSKSPEFGGKDVLGQEVVLRFPFVEGEGMRAEDSLAVPLRVVGRVEDRDAFFVPRLLVENVMRWRAKKLEFNESTSEFESPLERTLKSGYLRCNLYAKGQEQVEPLVARLQGAGYSTVDHLAEQKALLDLARVLVSVVVFFVSGCVVIAGITVWLTTTLNLQSKTWEIGILRSMGVPSRDVIGIFLTQGLLMGGLAYGLALLGFVAVQGWFRGAVASALSIKEPAFLEGRPWDPGLLWLPGVVLAVSLGFSLLGVLLPSARASRLIPADALRRRE